MSFQRKDLELEDANFLVNKLKIDLEESESKVQQVQVQVQVQEGEKICDTNVKMSCDVKEFRPNLKATDAFINYIR